MIAVERNFQARFATDDAIAGLNSAPALGGARFNLRGGNIVSRSSLSKTVTASLIRVAIAISFELSERLEELSKLEPGWDGENAKPLSHGKIANALCFFAVLARMHPHFSLPFLAPTFSGELVLEWANGNRTLEIETTPTGWSVVGTLIHLNGEREYFSGECLETDPKLTRFYDWFINNELLWPAA